MASVKSDRRIFYLSKHYAYPLGGPRITNRHVALLRRNGYDARLLLTEVDGDPFFDQTDVKVDLLSPDMVIRRSDIFVTPEPWANFIRRVSQLPVRSLIFCQNHYYLTHGLPNGQSFEEAGVHGVFCCSTVIADFLKENYGLAEVPVVRNAIDLELFHPRPKVPKIAYMPRKMRNESAFIEGLFRRRHPKWRDVPWVRIAGMTEAEVAKAMGESAVFLALGRMEGFGLPPLEALASGCLVVGFTADGGREFATPENGYWFDHEDHTGVVDALARALEAFGTPAAEAMAANGRKTAERYSQDEMERDLLNFWAAEVAR